MAKINWSGLVVLTAVALGSALGFGTAPVAEAQDARAPMVRLETQRPTHAQRGAVVVRTADARSGGGQRHATSSERLSAMERGADQKPAQMRRDAPTRERGDVVRAGNGTPRGR